MAVAFVQARSAQGSGTSVNVSITTTAGNLLAISTGTFAVAGATPTRTGESVSSAIADINTGSGNEHIRGDYIASCQGDSDNVVCAPASGSFVAGTATEFSGGSGSLGATKPTNTNTGSNTIQPGSITPATGSSLWSGITGGSSGNVAPTIDSSFNVDESSGAGTVWDQAGAVGGTAHLDGASGATNPTWTRNWSGTQRLAAFMVEILVAGGAAQDTPELYGRPYGHQGQSQMQQVLAQ